MARRNREINIFNMSLLDILCGALGAFCFMMLAALPYYTPGSIPAQERDKEVQALLNEIDEVIKKKLKNEELGQELAEKLKRLEARIKELQGELNSMTHQRDDLQKQTQELIAKLEQKEQQLAKSEKAREDAEAAAQRLAAQNKDLQDRLNSTTAKLQESEKQRAELEARLAQAETARKKAEATAQNLADRNKALQDQLGAAQARAEQAETQNKDLQAKLKQTRNDLENRMHLPEFLINSDSNRLWVTASSDSTLQRLNVELISYKGTTLEDKPFDPRVMQTNANKWFIATVGHPQLCGQGVFIKADVTAVKLYYSQYGLVGQKDASSMINGFALGKDFVAPLPEARLTGDRAWILVGVFQRDEMDKKLRFVPATPEEREKDWQEVNERIKGTEPDKKSTPVGPALPKEK